MDKHYLVIDIGSGSIRATLLNENLIPVEIQQQYRTAAVTLSAEHEWDTVKELIKKITCKAQNICVVGVTSLVGWVAVDMNAVPVSPVFTWMDQKKELAGMFSEAIDSHLFYEKTGRRTSPELGGFKLKYLKLNSPEAYEATKFFFTLKDYINLRLTGAACIDYTSACYSAVYNINKKDYDTELIKILDIDQSKLPHLKASYEQVGVILEDVANQTGLPQGIPVCVSGPDGSVGLLGADGIEDGTAVSTMGTTDVIFVTSKHKVTDNTQSVVVNNHLLPDLWLIGGPLGVSGGALKWLSESLLDNSKSLSELNILSAAIPPGSEGLMIIPSFTGERTPYWYPDIKGTVCGLTSNHHAGHFARAIMESNSYTIKKVLDICGQAGCLTKKFIAIGGGANSEPWLQIKSDVLGMPVFVPEVLEASTRGCAILAKMCEGCSFVSSNAYIKKITPNPEKTERYRSLSERYFKFLEEMISFY